MKEAKYSLNQVIYFVHGQQVIKGKIDELILHYTQKNVIIKYIIRPYGLDNFVTIDEDKIYIDLEKAKQYTIEEFKKTYTRRNIKQNYKKAKKEMEDKFTNALKTFDVKFAEVIDAIESISDEYFDNLEKAKKEKEKKDGK